MSDPHAVRPEEALSEAEMASRSTVLRDEALTSSASPQDERGSGGRAPLYTRGILRLAASIPFLDPLDAPDGTAERGAAACGSRVAVAVRMDKGRVAALSQRVEACAFGQAAAALMGANAVGSGEAELRTAIAGIEAWLGGDDGAAASWPGLKVLEPARARAGRHGAILLPFTALLAAIEDAR